MEAKKSQFGGNAFPGGQADYMSEKKLVQLSFRIDINTHSCRLLLETQGAVSS